MNNLSYYTLSLSGGKDSVALFFRLLEERERSRGSVKLDEVVFVDLGDEFPAIYEVIDRIERICEEQSILFTRLGLNESKEYRNYLAAGGEAIGMFRFMARHHVKKNGGVGYQWCGKMRWGTALKRIRLNSYYQSLERFVIEYVGIAADETHRIDIQPHKNYAKVYPLIKWGMSEADCLEYCREKGIRWEQNGVCLYDILDRVSCAHCQNKNLSELYNIWKYLPDVWESFKDWQTEFTMPYRRNGETVFDLEKRFEQMKDHE